MRQSALAHAYPLTQMSATRRWLEKPLTAREKEVVRRLFRQPPDASVNDIVDAWLGARRLSTDPDYLLRYFSRVILDMHRHKRKRQRRARGRQQGQRVLLVVE